MAVEGDDICRNNFEKMSMLMATIIDIQREQFDSVINNFLKYTVKSVMADKGQICLFSNDEKTDCIYGWNSPDLILKQLKPLNIGEMGWLRTQIHRLNAVGVTDPENLPREAKNEKNMLKEQGIKSFIEIPLVLEKEAIGFMLIESHCESIDWSDDQKKILDTAASLLVKVFEKKKKDDIINYENELLRKKDRTKSEFISMASHELRTPLTGMIGLTQTLLAKDIELTDEEKERFLTIIESEGRRLATLLSELLDLTKLEAGVLQLNKTKVNISELVYDAVSAIKLPQRVTVKFDFDKNNPVCSIADSKHVRQVITALINNTMRYNEENVTVVVTITSDDSFVKITVADNGLGIAKDEIPKIFDKFYRPKNTRKSESRGSGLELTVAKSIVEALGGKIWVHSENGMGCTFVFTLLKCDW